MAIANPAKIAVFTMDVQAVQLAPMLKASAVYYKTKLCVHNFTIRIAANGDVSCYLWNESNGGLDGNVFVSFISDHLMNVVHTSCLEKIIVYSDGCCYQNRNVSVSNALVYFITLKLSN